MPRLVCTASACKREYSFPMDSKSPPPRFCQDCNHPLEEVQEKDPGFSGAEQAGFAGGAGAAAGAGVAWGIPLLLKGVGFGAGGVAKGSMAAAAQSSFYGAAVGKGSLFATCQSIGAGGTSLLPAAGVVGLGVAGAVGAGLLAKNYFSKKSEDEDKSRDDQDKPDGKSDGAAAAGAVVAVPAADGAVSNVSGSRFIAGPTTVDTLSTSLPSFSNSEVSSGAVTAGSSFAVAQSIAMGGTALGPARAVAGLVKNYFSQKSEDEAKSGDDRDKPVSSGVVAASASSGTSYWAY